MISPALTREICNGIMATTAIITFIVFAEYIYRYWMEHRRPYRDITFQAALAIVVLMAGHFLRAFTSWLGFFWRRMGWTSTYAGGGPDFAVGIDMYWFTSGWIFAIATAVIVLGKLMVILAFAPDSIWIGKTRISWRLHLQVVFVFLCLVPFWVTLTTHP